LVHLMRSLVLCPPEDREAAMAAVDCLTICAYPMTVLSATRGERLTCRF